MNPRQLNLQPSNGRFSLLKWRYVESGASEQKMDKAELWTMIRGSLEAVTVAPSKLWRS